MDLTDKIKNSWWVILSFVMVLNGVGFIYIGSKHNNRNWIIEGIIYEVPWFFYFTLFGVYGLSYPTYLSWTHIDDDKYNTLSMGGSQAWLCL